jgi:hypothetical protein
MEATLGTLERYSSENSRKVSDIAFGVRGWVRGVFGCGHKQMSRPFSRQGENYRVCLGCGAHRRFDPKTWNASGPYYYRRASTSDLLETNSSALRVA